MNDAHESLLAKVRTALVEEFDVRPGKVVRDTRLEDDLGLDSIDAADLIDRIRRETGKDVEISRFRGAVTVGDVVDELAKL